MKDSNYRPRANIAEVWRQAFPSPDLKTFMAAMLKLHNIKYHPAARAAPCMAYADFIAFLVTVERHGIQHSIIYDRESRVVDGLHRVLAMLIFGREIPPHLKVTIDCADDADVSTNVAIANVYRRQLSQGQRALLVLDLQKRGARVPDVAKLAKVSKASLSRGATVIASGQSKIIARVADGSLSVSRAEKMVSGRLPRNEMPTVAQSRRTAPERGKPSKPVHAGRPRGNVTINRLTQLIRQVSEICKSEDEIAKYWPGDPNAVSAFRAALKTFRRVFDAIKHLPDTRLGTETAQTEQKKRKTPRPR